METAAIKRHFRSISLNRFNGRLHCLVFHSYDVGLFSGLASVCLVNEIICMRWRA
ncbi:Uncharacterized protein APZ42_031999 [Daphnia magna]|uniref:Uncharacterized protein n=1 Tax=Daphnia magna TaxID=35525 RepID=A0A164MG87_9CRUS|nr:Uncharacterized protein APZ42_031999 [Daphnia magna]